MTINLNEGRKYFPVSQSDNLVDQLNKFRINPTHKNELENVINTFGDVNLSTENQVVDGGITIINQQVNGRTRSKQIVPQKRRIPSKYENRLRDDKTNIEALYDIRSNQSRVVDGQILNERIHDRSKSKVFNKPSINYLFQPSSQTVNGFHSDQFRSYNPDPREMMNSQFDLDFSTSDEGLLKFNVNSTGYNPLLMKDQFNRINHSLNPNYPDERQTRYSGERTYLTKGDRQLTARELATSDDNKSKRQLQNAANDALRGVVHSERKYVPLFQKGVNVKYDTNSTDINPDHNQLDSQQLSSQQSNQMRKIKKYRHIDSELDSERFISRDIILSNDFGVGCGNGIENNLINGYNQISMTTGESLKPLFKFEEDDRFKKDVNRKLLNQNNDDHKLYSQHLIEQFDSTQRHKHVDDDQSNRLFDDSKIELLKSNVENNSQLSIDSRINSNDVQNLTRQFDEKSIDLLKDQHQFNSTLTQLNLDRIDSTNSRVDSNQSTHPNQSIRIFNDNSLSDKRFDDSNSNSISKFHPTDIENLNDKYVLDPHHNPHLNPKTMSRQYSSVKEYQDDINQTIGSSIEFKPKEVNPFKSLFDMIKYSLQSVLSNQHNQSLENGDGIESTIEINDQLSTSVRSKSIDDYILYNVNQNLVKTSEDLEVDNPKIKSSTTAQMIITLNQDQHQQSTLVKSLLQLSPDKKSIRIIQQLTKVKLNDVNFGVDTNDSNDNRVEYILTEVPISTLSKNGIRIRDRSSTTSTSSNRSHPEIVELNYQDHIKIVKLVDSIPDSMKFKSKTPMTIYQRDLLEDDELDLNTFVSTQVEKLKPKLYHQLLTLRLNDKNKLTRLQSSDSKQKSIDHNVIYESQSNSTSTIPSRDFQQTTFNKDVNPKHITSRFNSD